MPLTTTSACALALLALAGMAAADDTYRVKFDVTVAPKTYGEIILEVHPEWAPLGAARFREMLDDPKFFKGLRFFRVIAGFMAQFGIAGNPKEAAKWREMKIQDDPVVKSNERGYVSFATSGPNSRTTQMFINFGNNANLDGMGFAPFAKVVSGMATVDQIYDGYGEGAPSGNGPNQGRIQSEGNRYLKKEFGKLSFITKATILEDAANTEL